MDSSDIDFVALRTDLDREVERFTNVSLGWTITVILRFVVLIGQYRPMTGSSFIKMPEALVGKHAIVNVHNPNDYMCFAWAVLSALYPVDHNTERVSQYRSYLNSVDLSDIEFPTPVNQIGRF